MKMKFAEKLLTPPPPCQTQSKFATQFWIQSTRTHIIFHVILFVERYVHILEWPDELFPKLRNYQWAQPVGTAQQLHRKAGRILGKRGVI